MLFSVGALKGFFLSLTLHYVKLFKLFKVYHAMQHNFKHRCGVRFQIIYIW